MKLVLSAGLALSLLGGTAVAAQPDTHLRVSQNENRDWQDNGRQDRRDQGTSDRWQMRDRDRNSDVRATGQRWSRGDRLPDRYRQDRYYVGDWRARGLHRPPRGYRWVHDDNDNFFLAAIATGIIATAIYASDRDQIWNRHYSHTYSYNDDVYYRECRNGPDPAGVIAGAIIGGLIGNAVGRGGGRAGATIAGVVLGGAAGAALTSHLDCEDRSYAYRSYYDGFNSGRPGSSYAWHNPRNGHRGEIHVGSYYDDPYGFRCANFTQTNYIRGRSYDARGRACRQPDGTWAVLN